MYHKIEDQEKHPENYILKNIDPGTIEDECFDFISRPRQTQKTIGQYLKKIKGAKNSPPVKEPDETKKRFSLAPGSESLENEVQRNKGFWVGRPEVAAPMTYKLREKYSVNIDRKAKREQGIFYRPKTLELDYLMKMAKAGLLYPEEEFSDSEEEVRPDDTNCIPLRKAVYKICDPCKDEKERKKEVKMVSPKNLIDDMRRTGTKPPFKKIPTGCECDYYGDHKQPPEIWDNPYENELDMLRQHEMNKVLRPYKHELLNKYYEKHPPVKFMAHEPGMKKTFPVYQISNL